LSVSNAFIVHLLRFEPVSWPSSSSPKRDHAVRADSMEPWYHRGIGQNEPGAVQISPAGTSKHGGDGMSRYFAGVYQIGDV
jgi:hypothetical protein